MDFIVSLTEHSGQADQEDQLGAGGGNQLMEGPVYGGHHSQRRWNDALNTPSLWFLKIKIIITPSVLFNSSS